MKVFIVTYDHSGLDDLPNKEIIAIYSSEEEALKHTHEGNEEDCAMPFRMEEHEVIK